MDFKKRALEWIIVFLLTQLVLFLLFIFNIIITIMNVPDLLISVFIFPFIEELYKYCASKQYHDKAFLIIIAFAISELLFSKVAFIDLSNHGNALILILAALISVNFHISTAFVYRRDVFLLRPRSTFFCMFIFHSIYNSISYLNVTDSAILAFAAVASLTPYIWFVLLNRVSNAYEDKSQ